MPLPQLTTGASAELGTKSDACVGLRLLFILATFLSFVPLAASQSWTLIWSDEFSGPAGSAPDSSNWKFETGNNNGWGNAELEYYCPPTNNNPPCSSTSPNAFLDGSGNLVIQAIHTASGTWTSARMKTEGLEEFQYGRIEARMKLPTGAGLWPAFWMLGTNIGSVGWPSCGEQDIMEWVPQYTPTTTSSTIHGPGYSGGSGIGSRFTFPSGGQVDDPGFHTYGVIWSQDQMQFYRDDYTQPFFTVTPANLPAGKQWAFNHPFFILLNLAVGGNFPKPPPDNSTPNPATILVDYVRVYEQSPTVTVTSSGNPSIFGQPVTFTATLTPASATGTVQFQDGGANLGVPAAVSSGSATSGPFSLSAGAHNITAVYSGDSNFATNSGSLPTQTVNQAHSSTTVSSSPDPSAFGQTVTFTAAVSVVVPGAGTLTGNVQFKDGTTNLGTPVAVSNGSATFSTSSLAVGPHSITADYSGDANFVGSSGSLPTQTVNQAHSSTTMSSSLNPSAFGQAVTFTGTVSAVAPGAGALSGNVQFKDGTANLGTPVAVSNGSATFNISSLTAGAHSITAVYSGDGNFAGSTGSLPIQTVNPGGSNTSLISSVDPSSAGQPVTFTATVAPVEATGSVTFQDGSGSIGTGTLGGGIATFSTSALTPGPHSITASYGGDGNYASSASSELTQMVMAQGSAASVTTLVASPAPPGKTFFRQQASFSISVSSSSTPDGSVVLLDGDRELGPPLTLNSGSAALQSPLEVGEHEIRAVYQGTSNFSGSASSVQKVNASPWPKPKP
jgi:beta-glucanase (GH16 family)